MRDRGVGTQLGEQLAKASDLSDVVAIVRKAVRAAGMTSCEIVCSGEPRRRPLGIEVPILGSQGVVATLACRSKAPVTRAGERQLATIAMYLSVWWTNRRVDRAPLHERLTPRQLEIARFAANGGANAEIATVLGISVNTVKARLKEAFERLGVNNRTELAKALQQLAAGGEAQRATGGKLRQATAR